MNIWTILGIGQTDDKDAIKQAYRERLKSVNPEEDADGFMELRNAYEALLAQAEKAELQTSSEQQKQSIEIYEQQLAVYREALADWQLPEE